MEDYRELRTFLISRFLQIVAVATVATTAVLWLIRRTYVAWIFKTLFGTADVDSIGLGRMIMACLFLLFKLAFSVLGRILPREVSSVMNLLTGTMSELASRMLDFGSATDAFNNLSLLKSALLWVVLLSCVVLILLPYSVAAVLYSRIVIKEISLIEERELEKKREYDRQRNLMLSDIAHDLRTPMTTLSGYAKALEDGLVPEEKKPEIYSSIQTKTARMNDLIGLLFDYVKLDSEGFTLVREPVDICETVRENAAFMYPDIEDAGLNLDISAPEYGIIRNIDKVQFSRVITNLISNAIRHNDTATRIGIYVYEETDPLDNMYDTGQPFRKDRKADPRKCAVVLVCDDGLPIDVEYAKHIFDPFVTGDESRNSKGGSGLGLSIAKKIINMHDGEIELVQGAGLQTVLRPVTCADGRPYTKAFVIRL